MFQGLPPSEEYDPNGVWFGVDPCLTDTGYHALENPGAEYALRDVDGVDWASVAFAALPRDKCSEE